MIRSPQLQYFKIRHYHYQNINILLAFNSAGLRICTKIYI
jgi:hypothetical protein